KEHDIESSLNYFNARYYNPSSGKFISNDPIFKPTEGGYQYVRNNPLTITDPSGKQIPDNSKLIKLSFSVVNYIQEHAVRLIPKQCIERCQIEKAKQDKIKKANSEERSFIYNTLVPSVGNGIRDIAKDVTLPIRVNPAVSGEEHVKRSEMISEALFFASLKLGKSPVDKFKKDIKGIGYIIGGVTGESPAQRLGYIYYDERFFAEFRKTLNDERAFSIFLAYTLLSEDKSEERLDAKFLLALSPEEKAGLKNTEILWKTMYVSSKDKKSK
ncbi:MAG TPA: RHS repeat-associated core domain-containing protein, partial [Candidatus Nanoarchaeia archaeon]|nr:RHS repeat-associated core domain-containing protein [Candidatus Nanoarchaeia archaeon]